MGNFLKVVLFVVGFLAAFTYIGMSIPQQASLPPEEFKFDASKIKTHKDVTDIGQKIFFGKGQCALCHSIGHSATARCPNIEGFGAKLTREFIYESLTQPRAYTYMDYRFSPPKFFPAKMPVINKPPIDLNNNEILSVIAFVQSQGGEVTVDPSEFRSSAGGMSGGGDKAAGRKVFGKLGCGRCHDAGGLGDGDRQAMIRQAVLDPFGGKKNAPRPVHKGFDSRMTIKDLNDVAAYLGSAN